MPLLKQPPFVPLATCTLRTYQLVQGSEIIRRDGTSVFVTEVSADAPYIMVKLTDGSEDTYRRRRRWRVAAPPAEVEVPFLSLPL